MKTILRYPELDFIIDFNITEIKNAAGAASFISVVHLQSGHVSESFAVFPALNTFPHLSHLI